MKKVLTLTTALLLGISFTACDELSDMLDISFEAPFETSFIIDVDDTTSTDPVITVTLSDKIDLKSDDADAELKKNLDNITDIQLKSIRMRVDEFTGNEFHSVSGQLVFNQNISITIPAYSPMDHAGGEFFEVSITEEVGELIGNALESSGEMSYELTAELEGGVPIYLKQTVVFVLDVTAKP